MTRSEYADNKTCLISPVKKLGKPKNWVESQSDNLIAATNASIVAVGIGKYRYTELVEIASSKDLVVPVDNFKELDKFITKLSYQAMGCRKYMDYI